MSETALVGYGMVCVGIVRIADNRFVIELHDREIGAKPRCIYAFLVGDEIIRAGSSRRPLKSRMREWERDVSRALSGVKSITPFHESDVWREALSNVEFGKVFARPGTVALTPVGEVNLYQTEESVIIARHQPRLCHDRKRHKLD